MMFSMAKRGELVPIRDRIDMSVESQMLDEYWQRRKAAAVKLGKNADLEWLGTLQRIQDSLHPLDIKLAKAVDCLTRAFGDLKNKLLEWKEANKNESEL